MAKVYIVEGPMKGQSLQLDGELFFVGRSSSNDIQINDDTVSRRHLKIFRLMSSYFVEDLKSKNGTFINGKAVNPGQSMQVDDNDLISMGRTQIRVVETLSFNPSADLSPTAFENEEKQETGLIDIEKRSWSNREMKIVQEMVDLAKDPPPREGLVEKALGILLEILPRVDRVAILLCDEKGEQIEEVFTKPRQAENKGKIGYSRTIVEEVLKNKTPVVMQHGSHDGPARDSEDGDTQEIQSALCVPILSNESIYGAVYVDGLEGPRAFRKEDALTVKTLADLAAMALEKCRKG
jgi:pSer/pThr/pTyr-binding forkhead associated (FHA) protein